MILSSDMLNALSKVTVQPDWYLWIKAKNRLTDEYEEVGLWSGLENHTLSVGGINRTYTGAGGLLGIDALTYGIGTNIQQQNVRLTVLDPAFFVAIRDYEPKYAPVELHLGLTDPETESFIGLTKVFDGFIDNIAESETLTNSEAEMTLVSSIRNGSRPLYSKQSDAYQRKRDANDTGRKYASIAGEQTVFWGMKSEKSKSNIRLPIIGSAGR
ncbi:hypothetical protein [Cereibacter changlensis]|uniref:hypothetical protein n=1 Tax=Cereibacter changlensis TaxID=402884 RepID=UPI004033857B